MPSKTNVSGISLGALSKDTGVVALPAGGLAVYVPYEEIWEIERFEGYVTTDVAIGTRNIDYFTDDNNGGIFNKMIDDRGVAASLSEDYLMSIDDDPGAWDVERRMAETIILFPGMRVVLDDVANISTGDQARIKFTGTRYRSTIHNKLTR